MDYITFYNLQIDTKQKLVSIELNGRQYYMKTNQNDSLQLIPITLAHSLRLPPMTHRSATVTSSMTKFNLLRCSFLIYTSYKIILYIYRTNFFNFMTIFP